MEWTVAIVIRLVAPLTVFRWPLLGIFLGIMADNLDVVIWDMMGVKDFSFYNQIDKYLDHYFYTLLLFTVFKWEYSVVKGTAILLYFYRTIGLIVYEFLNNRFVLFLFPNLFLLFYILQIISRKYFKKDLATSRKQAFVAVFLISIPKLAQEYFLHVWQFPFYTTIKSIWGGL